MWRLNVVAAAQQLDVAETIEAHDDAVGHCLVSTYEVRWAVRYPKPTLVFGSKVVSAIQNSPHTFSTRIHHTFLRSKLPRTSIGANIDSRGWCSPFQAILHLGLHPPTPWGHAGGLVWVESSKQSRGTRLNCVFCSFRGPYSTHCKSCEKTSFWTNKDKAWGLVGALLSLVHYYFNSFPWYITLLL